MKKILSLLVSLAILAVLYSFLDTEALIGTVAGTDPVLLGLSLALLIGVVGLSAARLMLLGQASGHRLGWRLSVEATFAANALNMVTPGKLGDLLKAFLLVDGSARGMPVALSLSVWEKLADLAVVFLIASAALAFVPGLRVVLVFIVPLAAILSAALLAPAVVGAAVRVKQRIAGGRFAFVERFHEAWQGLQARLADTGGARAGLIAVTALIWTGHLVQICLMAAALGAGGGIVFWLGVAGLLPVAFIAGLVPLTFAGVGTRDAALVLLLAPLMGGETAAALGILFWLRYLVPGLIGLAFVPKFMQATRTLMAARRKA